MRTILLLAIISASRAAVPGTFFWKPRLGIDLAVPTYAPDAAKKPNRENIRAGFVVVLEGYQAGLTVASLSTMLPIMGKYPHFNPSTAYYYTNVYRWFLRHISLLPDWVAGHGGNYMETHKVWTKRFHYMDKFVPTWLRHVLFFVSSDEWKKEEDEWKRWIKYSEPAFGKYYKFPSKRFNNFNSMRVKETIENLDITNASM